MSVQIKNIADGVQGYYIRNDRFNTTLITYNFYTPLNAESMATDSLLPYLLTSCSEDFRDYIKLNIALLELYGAELSCSVAKYGDCLHTKLGISVINDELAFENDRPVERACELLTRLILKPAVENGRFFDADVQREKRKTIERIEGEINNKRSFARTRLFEEMFKGTAYGKFIYGSVSEVERISGEELFDAFRRLLSTAMVRINVVSKDSPDGVFEKAEELFEGVERRNIFSVGDSLAIPEAAEPQIITERFNVSQGKLAIGFTSKLRGSFTQCAALSIFCDVFGGGPYSKLFENVREKQSLCYYCSASSRRNKGFVMVESGVEEKNADKTVEAVLKELEDMKNGLFDETKLEASKKAMTDALLGYYDSATALEVWYSRALDENISPEDAIGIIEKVTKEQIIDAAKGIKLHTVYRLLPKGEEEL